MHTDQWTASGPMWLHVYMYTESVVLAVYNLICKMDKKTKAISKFYPVERLQMLDEIKKLYL